MAYGLDDIDLAALKVSKISLFTVIYIANFEFGRFLIVLINLSTDRMLSL